MIIKLIILLYAKDQGTDYDGCGLSVCTQVHIVKPVFSKMKSLMAATCRHIDGNENISDLYCIVE